MNVIEYYKHIRSLGPFKAIDCLDQARIAAALDEKSMLAKATLPVDIWHETMPDGSAPLRFSLGVRCF